MNVGYLVERAKIVRAIRRFFDDLGFIEVETPVRIAAPAPEPHIDCPPVVTGKFLRASPEIQMKKLLAEGLERIYQIGPCFREGESGRHHNPEFTMIEWYRKGGTAQDIADDLEGLVRFLGLVRDEPGTPPMTRLSVREAYRRFAGWDPWQTFDQDRFDLDMAITIEPALAKLGGGVFLTDYPPEAASLARVVEREGARYADRWEFYWNGMELANCFTELCDGEEQAMRFFEARRERKVLKESDYPIDENFLACLPRIGAAAGIALGVDRLVMVLTGAERITEVRMGE